jgi:hypothetical protein
MARLALTARLTAQQRRQLAALKRHVKRVQERIRQSERLTAADYQKRVTI